MPFLWSHIIDASELRGISRTSAAWGWGFAAVAADGLPEPHIPTLSFIAGNLIESICIMHDKVQLLIEANLGRTINVTYDFHTERVTVVSVDRDGFVCRPVEAASQDGAEEFWLSYADVVNVEVVTSARSGR